MLALATSIHCSFSFDNGIWDFSVQGLLQFPQVNSILLKYKTRRSLNKTPQKKENWKLPSSRNPYFSSKCLIATYCLFPMKIMKTYFLLKKRASLHATCLQHTCSLQVIHLSKWIVDCEERDDFKDKGGFQANRNKICARVDQVRILGINSSHL